MTVVCVYAPFEQSPEYITEYAEKFGVFDTFGKSERDRIERISSAHSRILSFGGLIALKNLTDRFAKEEKGFEILRTERGKPYFSGNDNLKFNISHSGELSVAALVTDGGWDVGVDIEAVNGDRDFHKLAERFFSAEEREYLRVCSYNGVAFYKLWTEKEARAKLFGDGLARIVALRDERTEETFFSHFEVRHGGCNYVLTVCSPNFDGEVVTLTFGDIEIYKL